MLLEPDDDDHQNCDQDREDGCAHKHSDAVASTFFGLSFEP